jgi:hypothetical protein
MRLIALVICLCSLAGCAALGAVADILDPAPVPVCDSDSAGVQHDGRQCVKFSDDSYRWVD